MTGPVAERLFASNPVAVADDDADPFLTLSDTSDGIWIGWLGYRLGRRLEEFPDDGVPSDSPS